MKEVGRPCLRGRAVLPGEIRGGLVVVRRPEGLSGWGPCLG